MQEQELKQLKLINRLRKDCIEIDELKRINNLENKIILDLISLNREENEFLFYLADKYHYTI